MQLPTQLSHRKPNSHKGNFGHILILAGSAGFSGAGILASLSAIRSGAGLVTLGIPKSLNTPLLKIKPVEIMTLPLAETKEGTISYKAYTKLFSFLKKIDIVALGPGLSQNKSTQKLIRLLILKTSLPLVIDADGLNALCKHLDILYKRGKKNLITIITPHQGEMSRLINMNIGLLQKERKDVAKKLAKEYNAMVVLKGKNTIVASPKQEIYINKTGNPGMSTAGSGDVLTGVIAAFLAQKLNAFKAAKYAVYIHGLAGDLAAKEKTQIGMIASDIINKIPEALKRSS